MNKIPELDEMILRLKTRPETYESILKDDFDNRNTVTNLLRNKFSTWVRFHFFMCGVLTGTRFGKKIFFHNDKEYIIVIVRSKSLFHYYYCFDIIENDVVGLTLIECFELKDKDWVALGDIIILREELVRWF